MAEQISSERVQKLDEAKEIIAEFESHEDTQLVGARDALFEASRRIKYDGNFFENVERAMGITAGIAINAGYDEIASDASQLIEELEEELLNDG